MADEARAEVKQISPEGVQIEKILGLPGEERKRLVEELSKAPFLKYQEADKPNLPFLQKIAGQLLEDELTLLVPGAATLQKENPKQLKVRENDIKRMAGAFTFGVGEPARRREHLFDYSRKNFRFMGEYYQWDPTCKTFALKGIFAVEISIGGPNLAIEALKQIAAIEKRPLAELVENYLSLIEQGRKYWQDKANWPQMSSFDREMGELGYGFPQDGKYHKRVRVA